MVNQNEGQETPEEIARKHVNVESLKLARKYHKMITSEEKELFKYKMGQKTKKTLIYTGIAAGVALAFYLTGLGINQLSGKNTKQIMNSVILHWLNVSLKILSTRRKYLRLKIL